MKKSKASSSRAQAGAFGAAAFGGSSGFSSSFGASPASQLSCVYEPPELSSFSDPTVVVSFKNLQKRDSTTKTKALDDLLAHVAKVEEEKQTLEEGFLEAWVRLYARISIDNARQVRQRSHSLQGRIAVAFGKRIARCLPSLVGPWLCGLHDNDKLVIRAAQESLGAAFPTEEKRQGLWKVYHGALLEYCSNAVLYEDVKTLSDERTTNKDDAESKFARTIGSAVSTISRSLEVLDADTLRKQFKTYKELLDSEKLWALTEHPDSFLRQAVYKVTTNRLSFLNDSIDDTSLQRLSKALLGKGLRKEQNASTLQFVTLLARLTEKYPSVWTSHFTSQKKSAPELLQGFLKKLPPMPAPEFWKFLRNLLDNIPAPVAFPEATADGSAASKAPLLAAFHSGLTRKENYRAPSSEAWEDFLVLVERCFTVLDKPETRDEVASEYLLPLARHYIIPDEDGVAWTVSGTPQTQERIASRSAAIILEFSPSTASELVTTISAAAIERMKASLPEQSQGFKSSQQKVGELFVRWNALKAELSKSGNMTTMEDSINAATASEIRAAIHLLKSRNGKPFGAASALKYTVSSAVMSDISLKSELESFLTQDAPGLFGSPSTSEIIKLFQLVDTLDPSAQLYNKSLSTILHQSASPARTSTIQVFLESTWPSESNLATELSKVIKNDLHEFLKGDTSRISQINAALGNKTSPESLLDTVLAELTESLTISKAPIPSLQALSTAATQNQDAVRHHLESSSGSELIPKLLLLSRSSEDTQVRQLAADLSSKIRLMQSNGAIDAATTEALFRSIRDGLLNTTDASMSVQVLAELATQLIGEASDVRAITSQALVAEDDWKVSTERFLAASPPQSVSTLNALGGAVAWISDHAGSTSTNSDNAPYDASGKSVPLRLLSYTLRLMQQEIFSTELSEDEIRPTLIQISLLNEVLSDQISVLAKVPLSNTISDKAGSDAIDLLAQSQGLIRSWWMKSSSLRSSVLQRLLDQSKGNDSAAYYHARAYVTNGNEALEIDPTTIQQSEEDLLPSVRNPAGSFQEAAKFATAQQGSGRSRVANNLIAELARFNFDSQATAGLHLLTMLNCLMRSLNFDDTAFNQQHRLVLFVKHLIASIRLIDQTQALDTEAIKALQFILPMVKDIFDNFWTDLLEKLIFAYQLPSAGTAILESSLRLLGVLEKLIADEETNDDLKESWEARSPDVSNALIYLLERQAGRPSAHDQPQQIINTNLARRMEHLTIAAEAASSLYPVVASASPELQKAAFKVLHKTIPTGQEKVTMEAALNKDFVAKLPADLLALVVDAPSEVNDLAGEASLPPHLAQNLYSWKLIFDHWNGASFQVQDDYVNAIKEAKHIQSLLDLIFEVAINSRSKPIDASKLAFANFDANLEESPLRDCQLLVCHLYYLSLKHVPGLVRAWWRDECPRSLQKPVDEWSEQHFSALIVAAELEEVSSWATKQETDTPLEVKVSPRGRQVTAGYALDEQMSAISITLPSNYPLGVISVESLNRVGVEEKKWRTWLINAQGVMNFAPSSGGLGAVSDGLLGFRRNITGTLKGHTECAICYAIVNADRQLPTKKCGTCKQAFHGSCLFKWFRSSGGSSCPLCRTAFNYG